jgi:thiamine-monophosphate kinase
MREADVLARLRAMATHEGARGLLDDAALLDRLVITHDTIVEGVHFLPFDPPASVGWKLVAVNLSDLAGKGAVPAAALLSLTIAGESEWELEFLGGIEAACESYGLPLIGGDTVALPAGAPRVLGLTAIGRAGERTPARFGGEPGDLLWLVGPVGDSAAGLAQLLADRRATGPLIDIYRRPVPLLAAGVALAARARAMMDVSDGLLLDALRLAKASGCSVTIDLDAVELSSEFKAMRGDSIDALLFAATGGDDYALLAALAPDTDISTIPLPSGTTMTRIGKLDAGQPVLRLLSGGEPVALPEKLGFEHAGDDKKRTVAAPAPDRP